MKVEFHSGVVDKLGSACGFLRRASDAGAAVTVCADAATLDRLDQALWTAEPLSFVPHLRLRASPVPAKAVLERTRIRLVERCEDAPYGGVLLNLGPQTVPQCERYERIVEIVSNEPHDAAAGRLRWKHYLQTPGVQLVHQPRQGAR